MRRLGQLVHPLCFACFCSAVDMNVGQIYTLALGSLFTVIIGWHIAAATEVHRLRALSFLRRYGFHATVIKRQKGSLDVSVAAACGLGVIVAANAIACAFQVQSTTVLSYRVALIFDQSCASLFGSTDRIPCGPHTTAATAATRTLASLDRSPLSLASNTPCLLGDVLSVELFGCTNRRKSRCHDTLLV